MNTGDMAAVDSIRSAPILLRTVSGFVSQAWMLLVSLISFPIFMNLLGMEAFGLLGFYLTLQMVVRALDLGLTPTVIHELARASASPARGEGLAEMAGTFETSFAIGGAVIAVALFFLAPWIARDWLHGVGIAPDTIAVCVSIMAMQCGVGWLSAFYQSALIGLEHQVLLNAMRAIETTAGLPCALALVFLTGSDVRLVFYWQLGVAVAALFCYMVAFRHSLPTRVRTFGFQLDILRRVHGFASGMAAITITGLVLTYMDKIALSRILSLEQFGIYSLAAYAVAATYGALTQPMIAVMFPRLSSLATQGERTCSDTYHLTIQAIAVIAGPVLIGMMLFARDFLEVWMRSAEVANAAAVPIRWLALGSTLNALMIGPYLLQIASGWTSIGVRINILLLVIFLPSLLVLATYSGANGAAANFAMMNAAYLAVGLACTHARLLRGQARVAMLADIGPTALICAAVLGGTLLAPLGSLPIHARLVAGTVVVATAFVCCAFASGRVRNEALQKLRGWTRPAARPTVIRGIVQRDFAQGTAGADAARASTSPGNCPDHATAAFDKRSDCSK